VAEAAEATTRQTGVTFAIGQDVSPLDFIARRGDIQEFVPRPSQDNVNSADVHDVLLEKNIREYDVSPFEGGQRKKKKYKQTRTRQKKQHRRRRRRHSTRKHKK
jgi:hypothetical protein